MSQQLVKKGANGRYENVMPRSWIEAIKDKNTGQTLVEILQGFNMYFLPYNGNTSATRNMVPNVLRKKGLWITYVKYDGNVYTEWYAADELDDKSWGDSSNWRIGNNTLVGDITISANGNWVINGTETEFKAVGEKGNTPLLRVANNRLQVSYNLGDTYIDVTNNPVYTKFRWLATTGDTQANNVGRIQASTDEGKTWTNMSNDFTNNLHIKKYIGINESLPTSGIAEGTIYAKGPYYAEDDTLNDNPIYRLWVYAWKGDTLAWQDNGEFTSIAAGIVQETGDNENAVMSQKATVAAIKEETDRAKEAEEAIIHGVSALKGVVEGVSNTVTAKQGVRYTNTIPISLKTGDIVEISLFGEGLIDKKCNVQDDYIIDNGTLDDYIEQVDYGVAKTISIPRDTERLKITVGSYGVVGDGNITLKVRYGAILTSESHILGVVSSNVNSLDGRIDRMEYVNKSFDLHSSDLADEEIWHKGYFYNGEPVLSENYGRIFTDLFSYEENKDIIIYKEGIVEQNEYINEVRGIRVLFYGKDYEFLGENIVGANCELSNLTHSTGASYFRIYVTIFIGKDDSTLSNVFTNYAQYFKCCNVESILVNNTVKAVEGLESSLSEIKGTLDGDMFSISSNPNKETIIAVGYSRYTGSQKKYLFGSNDGINFKKVKTLDNFYKDNGYDIALTYYNGYYYICFDSTTSSRIIYEPTELSGQSINQGSNKLIITRTKDFVNFDEFKTIEWEHLVDEEVVVEWSPRFFIDNGLNIAVSCAFLVNGKLETYTSSIGSVGHKKYIYVIKFNEEILPIEAHKLNINDDGDTNSISKIDPFIVKKDGEYFLFVKRHDKMSIAEYSSDSLVGTFEIVYDFYEQEHTEAPSVVRSGGKYKLYGYNGKHQVVSVSDDLRTWTKPFEKVNFEGLSGYGIDNSQYIVIADSFKSKTIEYINNDVGLLSIKPDTIYILSNAVVIKDIDILDFPMGASCEIIGDNYTIQIPSKCNSTLINPIHTEQMRKVQIYKYGEKLYFL